MIIKLTYCCGVTVATVICTSDGLDVRLALDCLGFVK